MDLVRAFHEGGFTMYWIVYFGLVAVAFGIVHAIVAGRWSFIVSAILAVVIAGVAASGTAFGRRKVNDAVLGLGSEPELRERILAQGYAEAMRPVQLGGIVIALVAIPGAVGEVRRRRRAG